MFKSTVFRLLFVLVIFCSVKSDEISLNSKDSGAEWTLENKNGSIKIVGSVPGGVYSDLQNAGVIGNIFDRFNDVNTRWVAYDTWVYTGKFYVQKELLNKRVVHIVFHGVDTVGYIDLNGSPIGTTNNMFVRYVFDVKEHLQEGLNVLKITLPSAVESANIRSNKYFTPPACVPDEYHGECHVNQLRKMQASFSWDWGPAFPSVGLWKSASLEFYDSAIIRSVTTHLKKDNEHWKLKIKVFMESTRKMSNIDGYLESILYIDKEHSITMSKEINVKTAEDGTVEADINMTISENVVSLWWPNGYGDQPLYDLHISFRSNDYSENPSHKHIRIGFRTVELIEEDASTILGHSIAGKGLTFYFKVNGYPLFMKGTNWIPSHILPEYADNYKTIDSLLGAAQEAHMAMIRVWGGGIYEPDYFYNRCDELGILVWQDFLFACSMYPVDTEFLSNVRLEIEQNVLRLQHHPSIAVWAGNNENEGALRGNWYNTASQFEQYKQEYIKLYVHTMKPIVENLDPGRRYLISSPSNGIETEREGYIAQNPGDPNYGDTHYYNYVNDLWDQNIYPNTRFSSEYGVQSLPSLATMRAATNDTEDYNVKSNYSIHREHSPLGYAPIKSLINLHLKLNESDPNYFEKFVFYSQISQAMAIKAESEFYRQSQDYWYTMGALYWQLNDIWQAPSWSGIEYGGKWKMMHYFAKSFFAPVLVSPRRLLTGDVDVYLINDRFVPINEATITVEFFEWNSLIPFMSEKYSASVGPLTAKKQNINLNSWTYSRNSSIFLRFSLQAEGVQSSPYNYIFPVKLREIQGLQEPNIKITVSSRIDMRHSENRYVVDIQVDTVVLFLWLETEDADGRFEENGFIVTQPYLRVNYVTKRHFSSEQLEKIITYKYYIN